MKTTIVGTKETCHAAIKISRYLVRNTMFMNFVYFEATLARLSKSEALLTIAVCLSYAV